MKKGFITFLVMLFILCGCSKKASMSEEELVAAIIAANQTEKLKEDHKNIYYKNEREENVYSVYDDKSVTAVTYYDQSDNVNKITYRKNDFLYSMDQEGLFSQELILRDLSDPWSLGEKLLEVLEFEQIDTSDVFYLVKAHVDRKDIVSLYEDKTDASSLSLNLLISKSDYSLQSIQSETITYDDGRKEVLSELEFFYDEGNKDSEFTKLIEDHIAGIKNYRSFTVITDSEGKEKTSVQYNVLSGDNSGVLLPEGYQIIKRLSVFDNDLCDNDVTYYITNKEAKEMEKEHDEPMSADNIYPDDTSGFVLLSEYIPDALFEIRYASTYNFVGDVIDGYNQPLALLSKEAAKALKGVADDLKKQGYRLKIYDTYRPKSASDHFVKWANEVRDTRMKAYFYPDVNKEDLFKLGYITSNSSHSRGSSVDLTLFDMNSGKEVDMGSVFDLFSEVSHSDYTDLSEEQLNNRALLKQAMEAHGFLSLEEEWWHFTLENEPYPNTYFTFPVSMNSFEQ